MNWNNVSLVVLGLTAFLSAFLAALWISLVIWTFRDMRARARDAFAQLLAALMVLVLGPLGVILYLVLRPRETLSEKYERSLEEEALLQDIEERQICPGCKQPIEVDYVLCPICHTRLRQPCTHCQRLIHPRWSMCPYCGESQKAVPGVEEAGRVTLLDLEEEAQVAPQGPRLSGERESVAELEQAALRNVRQPRYSEPLVPAWDQAEGGQPDPASGDASLSEPSAPEAEESKMEDGTSQTSQRPLSLFRRR